MSLWPGARMASVLADTVTLHSCVAPFLPVACVLVEQPPPPGTYAVQIEVRNDRLDPVPFTVYAGGQPRGNAVQPPSGPVGPSRTAVTFYLPIADDWEIAIGYMGDIGSITGQGMEQTFKRECPIPSSSSQRRGDWSFGCGP